jgi:hypothetical protein
VLAFVHDLGVDDLVVGGLLLAVTGLLASGLTAGLAAGGGGRPRLLVQT